MSCIKLLSPEVASRIAAGEVIERPASALKELLENALDAGPKTVAVEVEGAGRRTLRVSDDGEGMDRADCESCLSRHATSKISRIEDLESLSTFGFRGEALYAIAAVSRLSISSCRKDAKSGWKVEAEGGKLLSSGPSSSAPGTTVLVRDLFFNTPARLKFLKSDAFEKSRLVSVIEEAALANPKARFSYKSEGRISLQFAPESGDALEAARRRVSAVFGRDIAGKLLSVSAQRPGLSVRMFVSPADGLVSTREFQNWFVNRRPVASRILQQALYKATSEVRSRDRHPVCVAFLELSPEAFDVNVHPGKREIRFKSDRDAFEVVSGLIASALAKAKIAAPLVVYRATGDEPPVSTGGDVAGFVLRESVPAHYLGGRALMPDEPFFKLGSSPASALEAHAGAPRWFTPPYRFLGQIEKSYLVFEAAGGLFVLDQHAAAERILFERFLAEVEKGPKVQKLMLPIPIELPASALGKVLSQKKRLSRLGFEVEAGGKTTLHALAVPALFQKAEDLKGMIHRLLDAVADPAGAAQDSARDAVATIACKAAVKAHDSLGEKEAMRLLEDLKDCKDGSCCPHGRRAMLALNREELARRFQRPGAPPL